MTDAISIVASGAGLISGYVYQFVLSLAMAIASGDKDELVRVGLSLVAVWISFVILLRSSKLIVRIIRTAIKLVLLTASFVVALHIYNRGINAVSQDVVAWAHERLPELATLSATVSFYESAARKHILTGIDIAHEHIGAAYEQVRSQF